MRFLSVLGRRAPTAARFRVTSSHPALGILRLQTPRPPDTLIGSDVPSRFGAAEDTRSGGRAVPANAKPSPLVGSAPSRECRLWATSAWPLVERFFHED